MIASATSGIDIPLSSAASMSSGRSHGRWHQRGVRPRRDRRRGHRGHTRPGPSWTRAHLGVARAHRRGRSTTSGFVLHRVTATHEREAIHDRDLVIEAIVEVHAANAEVFASLDKLVTGARAFVEEQFGKASIIGRDRAGFVVNALLVLSSLPGSGWTRRASRPRKTSTGAWLGAVHPQGPLALAT